MGITRSKFHKRRSTGGRRKLWRKKRKFELARQPANTKLTAAAGKNDVRRVRVRGGNSKFRALRLQVGNYSWGSEQHCSKSRILDVVYNASNNELVRTKTLVKNAIVQVDATPFKQWYNAHYGVDLGRKKEGETAEKKTSKQVEKKQTRRLIGHNLEKSLEDQFQTGRLFACIGSRPGQCGRADGYILEGKELEFYLKKMQKKRGKGT